MAVIETLAANGGTSSTGTALAALAAIGGRLWLYGQLGQQLAACLSITSKPFSLEVEKVFFKFFRQRKTFFYCFNFFFFLLQSSVSFFSPSPSNSPFGGKIATPVNCTVDVLRS